MKFKTLMVIKAVVCLGFGHFLLPPKKAE